MPGSKLAVKTGDASAELNIESLRHQLSLFGKADLRKSRWQLIDTLVPYAALWVLMCCVIRRGYPYWAVFVPILLASFLLVRIFIFFHDAVHGSFFASDRANRILGYVTGILTFTPYDSWRRPHFIHHGTYANLDHRGVGDIWTLTVDEYLAASRRVRLTYRLYRSRAVLLGLGPSFLFLLVQRFPNKGDGRLERQSVIATNLAILAIMAMASVTIGLRTYVMIQLPVAIIGGTIGVWLFYVQHQFEGVYWARNEAWDPVRAALTGCSHYKLPKVLQWITGNIGLHHVHHVLQRVPNYRLQEAYDHVAVLQAAKKLSLRGSVRSLGLNLWDERRQRMVSFRSLKNAPDCRCSERRGGWHRQGSEVAR
jgi:acyl-lipid omega-6 desaturase (Delta-12 desaturase)